MPVTMALAARISQAMIPVACPLPKPRTTYSRSPPADGYRAPNLANEYPCSPAMAPAMRNEIQTAAPGHFPGRAEQGEDPGADHGADPDERGLTNVQRGGRRRVISFRAGHAG